MWSWSAFGRRRLIVPIQCSNDLIQEFKLLESCFILTVSKTRLFNMEGWRNECGNRVVRPKMLKSLTALATRKTRRNITKREEKRERKGANYVEIEAEYEKQKKGNTQTVL